MEERDFVVRQVYEVQQLERERVEQAARQTELDATNARMFEVIVNLDTLVKL